MAYTNLPSVLSIAKTASKTIAVTAPAAPQWRGKKLMAIDPEGVADFNADQQRFVTELIARISQALTEAPIKEV